MELSVNMEGVQALIARLQTVKQDTRYKGGRFAGRKAANVIAAAIKTRAQQLDDPQTAEHIAANVAVRWNNRRFKRSGDIAFRIGIRGGAKHRDGAENNPGKDTWYWRLLEFGHRKRQGKGRLKRMDKLSRAEKAELGTNSVAARPFMRPALQESAQAAIHTFVDEYQKAITRAIQRGNA